MDRNDDDVIDIEDVRSPYFGEPWPSGICDYGIQVPTPIGEPCFSCKVPIAEDDQGSFMNCVMAGGVTQIAQHKECLLRDVMGGIGHLEDHARWCNGEGDPDGGRTRRQSSLEVWDWIQRHGPAAAAAIPTD